MEKTIVKRKQKIIRKEKQRIERRDNEVDMKSRSSDVPNQ